MILKRPRRRNSHSRPLCALCTMHCSRLVVGLGLPAFLSPTLHTTKRDEYNLGKGSSSAKNLLLQWVSEAYIPRAYRTISLVHTYLDIFHCLSLPIIPEAIVDPLADELQGRLGAKRVLSRHVQIIHEGKQLLPSNRHIHTCQTKMNNYKDEYITAAQIEICLYAKLINWPHLT